MSDKFSEREKGFEKKFVRDEELQFKVQARSNKYIAEFVSKRLNKTEDEKQKYIQEVIKSEVEPFQFWIDENLITKFNAVPDVRIAKPSFLQRTFYRIRQRLGSRS